MRTLLCGLWLTFAAGPAVGQTAKPAFVTSDIDHFWVAYDQIVCTPDSVRQYAYLNRLFIAKGSPGLRALMDVR
ncbi:MAG: hypothetical protein H7330_14840, partial [Hymenobacteraceae bacterium]|nr:hypothetical protein [Hymenobacteraceae bacterium]